MAASHRTWTGFQSGRCSDVHFAVEPRHHLRVKSLRAINCMGVNLGAGQVAVVATLVRVQKRDTSACASTAWDEIARNAFQIKKLDDEEQVVFGEVYAPNFPDSQGDVMSREEVKKMAYNFLRKGVTSNIDVNHSQDPSGSYVVESFIARDGDPIFIPGSWVIGVKVPDAAVWKMVKSGELNGFSLDGYGVRTPTTFSVEMPELLKGETMTEGNHSHQFVVKYDRQGNFLGGYTNPASDGHVHQIVRGTVTEPSSGHVHRFSFVEGVLNVAA